MIPVSELRQGAAAVLDDIRSEGGPIVITQRGRAAAVLISVAEYERREHEREILELLAKGDREVAAGIGHDLADVLSEADKMLAAEAS